MLYRPDRKGRPISQLGYGCMRFTRKGSGIDYEKAEREVLLAIEQGVNYFDTAYIYPGSEECLGRILAENHCREKVYIATKLPQYLLRTAAAVEKTFREELERLRTDYIDYYLMHMFTDYSQWERLQALGIEDWIARKKAEGSIRSIGFSFHGDTQMFLKILNAYDWDFCQIQYNYLDEHTQAGRVGLQAAAKKGIPVIIMEPLRGGKLVNLPEKAKKVLKNYTPAELGLRWLWNQPEVTCVLSGMNSEEMVKENIRVASEAQPGHLTGEDLEMVETIKGIIREQEKVGCTGCRYCMPCPKGVDIPGIFHYYNLMYMEKKAPARFEFARNVGLRKEPGFATQCVGCGLCESHCPQHLPIRQKLKEADRDLRPLPYKIGIAIARKVTKQ
ncbi:MAG TPA: aldo/keto reductase [Candidatus Faecousia excrementigallinarum]|uniref:Aldo/keto reductase n=1 Tax=Candidatus Faecousia excrementigallinarum TaxID=2840806 RepID=A0A9D0Z425_9FIRM|nr:aldo/keto reductase [Candidatus Faecousia excrementigallinarum]